MTKEISESTWASCETSGPDDRRSRRLLLWTTLAWVLAFLGTTLVIRKELLGAGPLLWILAAVPGLLGIGVVLAYGRFLAQADELERLIQLRALALGFGGGLFALYGYWMFQRIGAPALDLADATLVLILLYVVGIFLGRRRYR